MEITTLLSLIFTTSWQLFNYPIRWGYLNGEPFEYSILTIAIGFFVFRFVIWLFMDVNGYEGSEGVEPGEPGTHEYYTSGW